MSKEKQIEEMARDICESCHDGVCYCDKKPCDLKCEFFTEAQYLYEKSYRKQSEWISVNERLPENFDAVLAVTKNGNPFVCRYDHGFERWAVSGRVNVTHWMPLPEAPKGGGE